MTRTSLVAGLLLTVISRGEADPDRRRCTWEQWGGSAAHDGQTCSLGQPATDKLARITFDPFVDQEMAESFGLLAHYQVPLSDAEDNVFMMAKTGTFVPCDPPGSGEPAPCGPDALDAQIWTEKRLHWEGKRLVEKWTFTSDWKPFPTSPWEPMFQPALSGPFVYVPGAGGSVWQVRKSNGRPVQRIAPFATVDPTTFVAGGITTDRFGLVYWNVIRIDPVTAEESSYLVRATPWGATATVSYAALTPGAPRATDLCYTTFRETSPRPARPWPPADQPDGSPTLPAQRACGPQRPGVNLTPAIGPDGTIFTASHAANSANYSFVIAVHPDLSPAWSASLRGRVFDGCGVLLPYGTNPFDCREGAAFGNDPLTNLRPALRVDDTSSSSPVALPDGSVLYGAFDDYWGQGKLVKLDSRGQLTAMYTFGWDSTPAVYQHDGTYSIVIKDNLYNSFGPFFITQLDKNLAVEWQFQNASIDDDHPDGFEWCINAPAVDRAGNVYATSEDGSFYAIGQGGVLRAKVFLAAAIGAAYTPLALDDRGRIYALNNGELTVLGR